MKKVQDYHVITQTEPGHINPYTIRLRTGSSCVVEPPTNTLEVDRLDCHTNPHFSVLDKHEVFEHFLS